MDLGDEACNVTRLLLSGSHRSLGSKVDPRDCQSVLIIDALQQENIKLLNHPIKNKAFPLTGVNLVDSVRLVTVGYHFVFAVMLFPLNIYTVMNIYKYVRISSLCICTI